MNASEIDVNIEEQGCDSICREETKNLQTRKLIKSKLPGSRDAYVIHRDKNFHKKKNSSK